ncbi:TonB-dependent receptor [Brevundimonas sp. 2R-24]|uniref:TonB-dependent receptor n=1 Tax=Peiella sedimenti TaxID=3061083 RepID=A0ABT8SLJ2_9CAUL|nr:TonB-dependent receptor [Caulobacteraceae bacterium XZ-24]
MITGARLPPALTEAGYSVVRLDSEELSEARRLDEALTSVPAVSLFRRTSSLSANPTTQGLSLRAIAPSGAGRALVTLDGVPLNDPFGGWVIWSQLPGEAVDRADIVRGGGSGPYGAGALTGVVALRERDSGPVVDLSAAEYGGRRLGAWGGTDLHGARLTASALLERSLGYVPVRGVAAGAADQPLDFEAAGGALRLDLPAGDGSLSLRASAWEESRGSGLEGARSRASGQLISATIAAPPLGDGFGWRVQGWTHGSDLSNSFVAVEDDRSATRRAASQDETPARGWGLNAALRRRIDLWDGQAEWELGADARTFEGETRERFRFMGGDFTRSRVAGGEASVVGAYAEAAWSGGPWLAAGGLRLDAWRNADGRRLERDRATGAPTLDLRPVGGSGEVLSGRAAGRRTFNGWSLRGAAYSAFRPATLNELHRPFRVGNDITEANPGLRPERLRGVDAGLEGRLGELSWAATLFWNEIDDAIVNVTIGEGPGVFPVAGFVPAGGVLRQRMNAGTIAAVGLETEAGWRAGPLELTAALSWTDAEVDGGADAPQLTGLRPAQAPELSATFGAAWDAHERWTLSGRVRWESDRFDDDLNSRVLEAAATVDLRAEWRMTPRTTLWLAADNLLNADVEVSETADGVAGFGPPRTLRLGLRWSGSGGGA